MSDDIAAARASERAAIVAWLRETFEKRRYGSQGDYDYAAQNDMYDVIADAIERGDHIAAEDAAGARIGEG